MRIPLPAIAGALLFPLILGSCSSSGVALGPLPASGRLREQIGRTLDRDLLASRVVEYINAYRSRHGIPPLRADRTVMIAAQWMADYQARRGVITHVAEAPELKRFGDRYRYHGGPDDAFGAENTGFYSLYDLDAERKRSYDEMARHIVTHWIKSPDHHDNLLARFENSPGVVGVGLTLGMYKGAEGTFATMDVFFR